MKWLGAVILGAVGLGCNGDSRCSPKNCDWYLNVCHQTVRAAPDKTFSFCAPAGAPPAGFDWNSYCPNACNQAKLGAQLDCLASHPECGDQVDGGAATALAACGGPPRAADPACAQDCSNKRESCEQACPLKSSFQSCADCVSSCSLNWQSCSDACPKV